MILFKEQESILKIMKLRPIVNKFGKIGAWRMRAGLDQPAPVFAMAWIVYGSRNQAPPLAMKPLGPRPVDEGVPAIFAR
jgi:hypothetical protein